MEFDPNPALGCSPTSDLGPYIGAALLGTFISMALWGIATMQLILFFASKHPGDSWRLKSLVVWVWAMDTIHKCLIMTGNYKDIVSGNAMNPRAPGSRVMIVTQSFPSLVAVPVQAFFVYRIWRLANRLRWIFIVPLAPCILFHFVMGFVLATINWIRRDNPNAIPRSIMVALIVADMSVGAAVDVLLAIGLCMILCRTYLEVVSGAPGPTSGLAMIQRLLVLTINTGIWTALFTVLTMTTSIKYPQTRIHIAFCYMISPVYVNMLLANLNARPFIRKGADKVIDFNKSEALSGRLSSFRVRSARMPTLVGSTVSSEDGSLQVTIESTRYTKDDDLSSKQIHLV
ncbi:hypothetical protein H1R20_g10091, partial [Candolleomyces eurysporus]